MQSHIIDDLTHLEVSEYLWEVTVIKPTHKQVYFAFGTTPKDAIRKLNDLEYIIHDTIIDVSRSCGYMKGYTDHKSIKDYDCKVLGIDINGRLVVSQNDNLRSQLHVELDANWVESLWERVICYHSS